MDFRVRSVMLRNRVGYLQIMNDAIEHSVPYGYVVGDVMGGLDGKWFTREWQSLRGSA
jgi:hypothetical protein